MRNTPDARERITLGTKTGGKRGKVFVKGAKTGTRRGNNQRSQLPERGILYPTRERQEAGRCKVPQNGREVNGSGER
jgi:hypothetical protein